MLDHTPSWLQRKFYQATKEKWEDSQARVMEGFKSMVLLVDSIFNDGKNYTDILPETFEKAMAQQQNNQSVNEKFVTGQWWKGDQ